jgi:hypothetical protein
VDKEADKPAAAGKGTKSAKDSQAAGKAAGAKDGAAEGKNP